MNIRASLTELCDAKRKVREGLAARFEGLPDVHYGHAEHFVDEAADTGISKWFLTATDLDGNKVEVRRGPSRCCAICPVTRIGSSLYRLTGVHCAPQFTRDGSVLAADGFHGGIDGTGCMLALGELNGQINSVALDEAKAEVRAFLALFLYSGPEDEAVLLSMFFTALSRRAVPFVPLHIFDAPRPGTGKSMAAVVISMLAGSVAPVVIPCADAAKDGDSEVRKRIETALVMGASGVVLLDDVPGSRVPNGPAEFKVATGSLPELPFGGIKNSGYGRELSELGFGEFTNRKRLPGRVTRRGAACSVNLGTGA